MFPSVLRSGEIAFLRADVQAQGVSMRAARPGRPATCAGPRGSRTAARWYTAGRLAAARAPRKLFSKNPQYELYSTGIPAGLDRSGERLRRDRDRDERSRCTLMLGRATAAEAAVESKDELDHLSAMSPRGETIIFGSEIRVVSRFCHRAKKADRSSQRRRADRGHPCRRVGFRKITSGANNNGFASYAPDGERTRLRTTGPEGDGLRIMNLKDRTVMSLTAEYDNFPVWSPRET